MEILAESRHLSGERTAWMSGKQASPIFFFAPFVSSARRIEPAWIDYNGHLNMAYYHVLFDRAVDEGFGVVGLGADYLAERGASFFAAEVHTLYRRELGLEDQVRVTLQLIDFDEKRIHFYLEIRHLAEGWVAASSENLALHVDMGTRKVVPFPDDILANLAIMKAAHGRLHRPASLGRVIGIPGRSEAREPLLVAGTRH
jgi:acyl-CoA thioester hydrolase